MDAVTEAAGSQRGNDRLQVLVVLPERKPAVHDEEDVTEAVACRPQLAVGRDRPDAMLGERAFPLVEYRAYFRHGAPHQIAACADRYPADVRQPAQRGPGAAAEVKHVEL